MNEVEYKYSSNNNQLPASQIMANLSFPPRLLPVLKIHTMWEEIAAVVSSILEI